MKIEEKGWYLKSIFCKQKGHKSKQEEWEDGKMEEKSGIKDYQLPKYSFRQQ